VRGERGHELRLLHEQDVLPVLVVLVALARVETLADSDELVHAFLLAPLADLARPAAVVGHGAGGEEVGGRRCGERNRGEMRCGAWRSRETRGGETRCGERRRVERRRRGAVVRLCRGAGAGVEQLRGAGRELGGGGAGVVEGGASRGGRGVLERG
jgi:hypothetical protein